MPTNTAKQKSSRRNKVFFQNKHKKTKKKSNKVVKTEFIKRVKLRESTERDNAIFQLHHEVHKAGFDLSVHLHIPFCVPHGGLINAYHFLMQAHK